MKIIKYLIIFSIVFLVVNPHFSITVRAAIENLNDFIENDTNNDITVNSATKVTVSSMRRDCSNSYLARELDYRVKDFTVEYEVYVYPHDPISAGARMHFVAFSNESRGDAYDSSIYPCIWAGGYISGDASNFPKLLCGYFHDGGKQETGSGVFTEATIRWCRTSRSSTTLTHTIYSNSARTVVEQTASRACADDPLRYFYTVQSHGGGGVGSAYASWYAQNYEFTYFEIDNEPRCDAPSNPVITLTEPDTIDLSWTKGYSANNTIVTMRTDRYPNSPTDGTIWYNGTGSSYQKTGLDVLGQIYYIRAWCESNWSSPDYYFLNTTNITFTYGGLTINVFDENTTDPIPEWEVFITNQSGTETYVNWSASNPCLVPLDSCPQGQDILFVFNATSDGYKEGDDTGYRYAQRSYYMDLTFQVVQTINIFLAPRNATELYLLTIFDEDGNTEPNVNVLIRKYINDSTGFGNIANMITDSNGQIMLHLIPNTLYKLTLNKTGYEDTYIDFIPSEIVYTYNFLIQYAEAEYPETPIETETVEFTAERIGTLLTIQFTDTLGLTTNFEIKTYQKNNTGTYLFNMTSRTGDSDHSIVLTVNATDDHICVLYYNHSIFGSVGRTITIPRDITTFSGLTKLNNFLVILIGYNPFGWANFTLWLFLLAGCYYSDGKHAGEVMTLIGGLFLFINLMIGSNSTLFTLAGGAIPSLFLLIGIIIMWKNHDKKVMG